MFFTSSNFIFFFALSLAAVCLSSQRSRPWVILAFNIVFYLFSGFAGFCCLAFTCVSTWYCGYRIESLTEQRALARACESMEDEERKAVLARIGASKRRWLVLCVVLNLSVLGLAKYTMFVLDNIGSLFFAAGFSVKLPELQMLFPLGISFYTFKAIAYVTDTYRSPKPGKGDKNPVNVAAFISFFPEVVQGPISRYGALDGTFLNPAPLTAEETAAAVRRILWGFFKKLVIADRLMPTLFALPGISEEQPAGAYALMTALVYAVTLYADFTGGIDITIGAARLMGVKVAENFNSPFLARGIADYWRRWHITMGTWFRDYLLYPFSTSRFMLWLQRVVKRAFGPSVSKHIHAAVVTMTMWFCVGVWHGATWNFIVWGLVNGVVFVVTQELEPLYARFHGRFGFTRSRGYAAFQIVRTFLMMAFIHTLDIYPTAGATLRAFFSIFINFDAAAVAANGLEALPLTTTDCVIAGLGTALMIATCFFAKRAAGKTPLLSVCLIHSVLLLTATLVFGCYGIGYDAQQFIYNRF